MSTSRNYTVALPHFEGPLELLISLIERRELEITELSISQVTGDYLATVSALKAAHTEDLQWFLDIGSKLVTYKTRAIQKDSLAIDDTKGLTDLTRELERYQAWRNTARLLGQNFTVEMQLRPAQETLVQQPPKNLSVKSLLSAWRNIASQKTTQQNKTHRVLISRSDIQKTMQQLLKNMINSQPLSSTLKTSDRRTKTLNLLAVLELIKQDLVELVFEKEEPYVHAI
ncbi:hypothetical protein IPM44_02250 [bacterium]|nr:MAG: hypothetical protein IPM44_02250 [bacterium]